VRRLIGVCLAIALTGAGCAHAGPGAPLRVPSAAQLPRSAGSRVAIVVMENAESEEVLGNASAPYINSLARRYGLAVSSFAISHPSLPNYLALTSGSTQGASSDCTSCHFRGANIVDQLQAAGISWRAYLEDAPRPCYRGASAGGYAKKHDPFIYYDDVSSAPARCARLTGFGALAADLRAGRLPTFVWITPNLCDDGHDCSLGSADRFLARTLPALLRELGPHGFLILTWDEGSSSLGCCGGQARGGRVVTIVAGPDVRAGAREAAPVDHYGVLATIERALGLGLLGAAADPRNGTLDGLFSRTPHIAAGG
jgi:hypothetical protein